MNGNARLLLDVEKIKRLSEEEKIARKERLSLLAKTILDSGILQKVEWELSKTLEITPKDKEESRLIGQELKELFLSTGTSCWEGIRLSDGVILICESRPYIYDDEESEESLFVWLKRNNFKVDFSRCFMSLESKFDLLLSEKEELELGLKAYEQG